MVTMNRFFKMAHLIPCHKTDDASYITEIYVREVIRLDGVHKSILLDQDSRFLPHL